MEQAGSPGQRAHLRLLLLEELEPHRALPLPTSTLASPPFCCPLARSTLEPSMRAPPGALSPQVNPYLVDNPKVGSPSPRQGVGEWGPAGLGCPGPLGPGPWDRQGATRPVPCPLGALPGASRAAYLTAGKHFYPFPEIKLPHFSLSNSELVSSPPCRRAVLVYSARD